MKATNLTDVETPRLRQHGMLSQSLCVGSVLLAPGQSCDVDDHQAPLVRAQMKHFLHVGAVALGDLPEGYVAAHGKK